MVPKLDIEFMEELRSISITEDMEGTVEYSTGGRINEALNERDG